jgi:hypothetical protein
VAALIFLSDFANLRPGGSMSEAYNRSVAVQAMVLLEIQKAESPILGMTLLERVEDRGMLAKARVPDYDFIGWIGCTIWEMLFSYVEVGWIALDRERPIWDYQMMDASIRITEAGAHFIESVRAEASTQLNYFA